jgi:hypothetical protein
MRLDSMVGKRLSMFQYVPRFFPLTGAGAVGYAIGRLGWRVAWNTTTQIVAVGIGALVGLALWVWTWFAFPEIEE